MQFILIPKDAEGHFQLALVMDIQGKSNVARTHYRNILRLRSEFTPARDNLKHIKNRQPPANEENDVSSNPDPPDNGTRWPYANLRRRSSQNPKSKTN